MKEDFLEIKDSLKILDYISIPWFVCGGWAVDLFMNKKTRKHKDVEVGIFRKDQSTVYTYLVDFTFWKIKSREMYLWAPGKFLELPIHEIWAEKNNERLEILLNEIDENNWVYRRNPIITSPLSKALLKSENGLLFLSPEIVLLYKSTHISEKDEYDFKTLLPRLGEEQKVWLRESLIAASPGHHWIEKL